MPVDDRGVEGELSLVVGVERVEAARSVWSSAKRSSACGVLAVEVEVAAQELQPAALLVELAGQVAGPVAARRVRR